MTERAVSAKKGDTTVSVSYDFGDTLEESVALFGDKVVQDGFLSNAVIGLQAFIRGMIERGFNAETITARAAQWKPGVSNRVPVDPIAAVEAAFAKMAPEARLNFLQALQAKIKA